jgi:hypothetical protein
VRTKPLLRELLGRAESEGNRSLTKKEPYEKYR